MKIDFYSSSFCPRCGVAGYALNKLKARYPGLELNTVPMPRHMRSAWKEGVRFIPALKIGDEILWGLFLTPKQVTRFVKKHLDRARKRIETP